MLSSAAAPGIGVDEGRIGVAPDVHLVAHALNSSPLAPRASAEPEPPPLPVALVLALKDCCARRRPACLQQRRCPLVGTWERGFLR